MEGLEISEIWLSEVLKENDLFRIEAEFFSKSFLALQNKIANYPSIGQYAKQITCGPFGSNLLDTEYKTSGVLVVRPFNLKDFKVENENLVYVTESYVKQNNLKKFGRGTLLFSRVGDIKIGVLDKDNATISPNIIAAEFNDFDLANFLAIFFSTKYGFNQIARQLKVAAQPTISTGIIQNLRFPNFSRKFILAISNLLNKSNEVLQSSQSFYTSAENLLLSALGLNNFESKKVETNYNIKSFKDSFLTSGRLDAEYYQPKYEILEQKVKNYEGGYDKLGNQLFDIQTGEFCDNYQPKQIDYSFYIRNTNIKKCLIEDDINYYVDSKKFTKFTKAGNILTARVGAIGSFGLVTEQFANCVYSDNVLCLSLKPELFPDVYTVYFNSQPNQILFERISGGSVQPLITQTSIKDVIIPIFKMELQTQISSQVQESFHLRAESERLLALAKEAVEVAIEKGEMEAEKLL